MANMMSNKVVNKNILDVLKKNPKAEVEISQVKIRQKAKAPSKRKKIIVKKKTIRKKQAMKKDASAKQIKHLKELKKHVRKLSGHMRKREVAVQKQLTQQFEHMQQVRQDVGEARQHYAHIPKLTMETQMLIDSMNKLTAVVKQLLVLFNQKISNEEGPLFARLDDIKEQNEKIAEALLVVADMMQEKQTPKAQIREFNPYMQRMGPSPEQVQQQMPTPQEEPAVPSDLGRFQFPGTEQAPEGPQPIPQYGAPLPPFSPVPVGAAASPLGQAPSRKRFLF